MRIKKDPVIGAWELAESDESVRPQSTSGMVPCNRKRILIVDDEASIRQITQKVLAPQLPPDILYDMAANGREAVDSFVDFHHKIILLDMAMPVMDGEEAAIRILEVCDENKWEYPSIIFRTGYDPSSNSRNMVASDPAHCLLRKPVRNQTLITAVKKRLNQ